MARRQTLIIGNPPFLGTNRLMRGILGDEYT